RRNLRRELRELRPGLERHPGGCRHSRLPADSRRDPAGNSHRGSARPQVAMELPLAFIGWFFTLASAGALVLGAALIAMLATDLGGIFGESYASCGRVSSVIPVDVAIPGCPPTPVAILQGILTAVAPGRK